MNQNQLNQAAQIGRFLGGIIVCLYCFIVIGSFIHILGLFYDFDKYYHPKLSFLAGAVLIMFIFATFKPSRNE